MAGKILFVLICLSTVMLRGGDKNQFTLVRKGKPAAAIIIDAKADKAARLAAAELRHAVHLMTGADLPIRTDLPQDGMARIFVGESSHAAELGFPGRRFVKEEYLVALKKGDLFLMGKDCRDAGRFDYQDVRTFPPLRYYYRSTTYAVYDFLENACSMRFYGFGDEGIAFQKTDTLIVKPRTVRRAPAMDAFRLPYFSDKPSRQLKVSKRDQQLLQYRWRSNAMFGLTNHSIYSIYYRYWDQSHIRDLKPLFIRRRPEFFASNTKYHMTSALRRHFSKDYPPPAQLCTSHPGPVEYFADCAEKFYEGKPVRASWGIDTRRMEDQPFFYPVQGDDCGDWCRCSLCLKKGSDYQFRHFDWINRIAARAAEKNPAVGISTLAYSDTLKYPASIQLNKNIAVQICLGIQSWYHPRVYAYQHGAYKDWVRHEAKNRPLSVWLYLLCPSHEARVVYRYQKYFPVLYPQAAGRIAREFVQDGIRGWFGEIDPAPHMLEAYVISRIADDPALDPEKLIDEYFRLYYGRAGDAMKQFYQTVESITWNIRNYSRHTQMAFPKSSFVYGLHRERDNWHLGTPERIARLEAMVRNAEQAAADPREKARVKLFRDRVWDQAVQGRKEFEEREKIRNIPLPRVTGDYAGECGGKLDKVDFNSANPLSQWKTLENEDAPDRPVQAAVSGDSTHFYFTFTEKGDEAFKHLKEDFWNNCLEFFLSSRREQDYLQIVVHPSGTARVFTNVIVEGTRRFAEKKIKLPVSSSCTEEQWNFRLAVPLAVIPSGVRPHSEIYGNFFRTRRYDGKKSLAWSPIFCNEYKAGLYRMGTILLPGPSRTGVICSGPFVLEPGRKEPKGWMMQNPPASLRGQDGTLMLQARPDKVSRLYYTGMKMTRRYHPESYFAASRGDRLVFQFTARGTGAVDLGAGLYNGRGNGANLQTVRQPLDNTAKACRVELVLENRHPARPVTSIRPLLSVPPNTQVEISGLTVILNPKTRKGEK